LASVHDLWVAALTEALYLALWLSLPTLGVGLAVALVVGLLQSMGQLAEPALNAIPRALAVGLTLAVAGAWMGTQLSAFAARLLHALPEYVR
jgi:flagellar biosynthetic protein FliQ